MDKKQKENGQNKKSKRKLKDELFGIETEDSLQSVKFATTENRYLNEHIQQESED